MSEARHQRFEIDIDEIERQLRQSVDATPSPKPDPLAELARIVGQDDPFRGILGGASRPGAPDPRREPAAVATAGPGTHDILSSETNPAYDPVTDTYGSADGAYAQEDFQPLQPQRSRSRLVAVTVGLVVAVGATGAFLAWRNPSINFGASGAPPVVTADKNPLKVAPEKPGGLEVPNQNKQIYERGTPDGQSRVVDSREQPVDVREAVRNLPPPPSAPVVATAPTPPAGGVVPSVTPGAAATAPAQPRNAMTSALGEPRRVRTVAVRPDGTTFTPSGTGSVANPAPPSLLPGSTFPPPVPVTTTTIPLSAAQAPAPIPAPAAPPAADAGGETAPSGPPVQVLPPQRPKAIGRGAAAPAPAAVAEAAPRAEASETTASTAPAGRTYAVQIAVRPSEDEARAAYSELSTRFAGALDGKPASVNRAEVGGKTVYRVRVGPLPKDGANALCTKLKAVGGQCFVAAGG